MIRKEEPFKGLDDKKKYVAPCGHNTIGALNVYPFDILVCLVCGKRTCTAFLKEVIVKKKRGE